MEAFRHDDPTINMVRWTSDFFTEIKIVYAVHVCTIKKCQNFGSNDYRYYFISIIKH